MTVFVLPILLLVLVLPIFGLVVVALVANEPSSQLAAARP
jgi:hypothetical protein